MKKKCFLVDFENVGIQGIEGIKRLTKNDLIILFYNQQNLKQIGKILSMYQMKYNIKIIELLNKGKNYLDFQIINTLGFLSSLYKNEYIYYIVSKDNGMDIGDRKSVV